MLLSFRKGEEGSGWEKKESLKWNLFLNGSFRTVNCIKHCLTDKCHRPQLEMLKQKKKIFFPKENNLLNYVSWIVFLSVLGKGERNWAGLRDSTCPERPESSTGKINKLHLKVNQELEEGWGLGPVLRITRWQSPCGSGASVIILGVDWIQGEIFKPSSNLSPSSFSGVLGGIFPLPLHQVKRTCDKKTKQNKVLTFSIWILLESILNPHFHA